MNLRQAAQQALEALIPLANAASPNERECLTDEDHERAAAAVEALEQALAEPERKPLTDEEIAQIAVECAATHKHDDLAFARAIEKAHGIGEEK